MKALTISNCYISCPMSVPQQTLDSYVEYAKKHLKANTVAYWERGTTYNVSKTKDLLRLTDAFIVVLPNNSFKHNIGSLPSGTRNELIQFLGFKEGWENGEKHLFIAYTNRADGPMFYSATYEINGLIEGVSGSKFNFRDYCSNYKTRTAEQAHDDLIDSFDDSKPIISLKDICMATGMIGVEAKRMVEELMRKGGDKLLFEYLESIGVRAKYNKNKPSGETIHSVLKLVDTPALQTKEEGYDRRILLLRRH